MVKLLHIHIYMHKKNYLKTKSLASPGTILWRKKKDLL